MRMSIPAVTTMMLITLASFCYGQSYKQMSSSEIYEEIQKLNFLGSVLYVAAHPDDENTRLISYVSKGLHARTAYISLTRGDGGQNLIGTEIRELLGVIRSQELQMARSVDGGQQFFTRANDFGYSKHPDETLKIWDKEKVLGDLVYAIREFKPDIIINRFDHRTPGRTHGHHTSSAMLSVEAFDLIGDKTAFGHQLSEVDTWTVTRQFMNTSWWFYGSRENFAKADKTNLIGVDAGIYYPTLGQSNGEFAALARSKHRSQGFGSSGARGSYTEYLELINGTMPDNKENLFDGINTTWSRIEGGSVLQPLATKLNSEFDFADPSTSLPTLLEMYRILNQLEDGHWKKVKLPQLQNIILQCAGLWAEASISQQQVSSGDSLEIQIELTNRSNYEAVVNNVYIDGIATDTKSELEPYTENKWYADYLVTDKNQFSNPYWLDEQGKLGVYKVKEMAMRIKPETPAALNAVFDLQIEGQDIQVTRPVIQRYSDPAIGEIRQPIAIIPAATLGFDKELYLFADESKKDIEVKVRAGTDNVKGVVSLQVPKGWSIQPASYEVEIANRGFEESYTFTLSAPATVSEGTIKGKVTIDGRVYDKKLTNIDYDHIPLQTVLSPASSKIVKVPLKKAGNNIGYVMGAGDKMPESLRNVGYNVTLIEPAALPNTELQSYDALVIGIRAYNKIKDLKLYNQFLFDYADAGGTLITQYNTSRRLNYKDLSPYEIKLSRKRVTDEFAEIRMLAPQHPALNQPNKITSADFDGWVQERGLYFAEEWGDEFTPLISCNDKGEDPLDGSILVAKHGEGHIVYTSISWFRQLPAGVPGAYRLFANLLSLGHGE